VESSSSNKSNKKVPVTQSNTLADVSSLPGDKEIKAMQELHQEIQALRTIKGTSPEILIQKLKPLRDIFGKKATQAQLPILEEKKS
jgi:hypothetical protein